MELKRFFASAEDFDGRYITLEGEEFEHMTKVLRHKVGFKIIVSLNDGKDYCCSIVDISKTYAKAEVDEIIDNECKSKASVSLFQALPKGDKLDIIPFKSRFTNESKYNVNRARRIALEACKQCGRARKANVGELVDFEEMIERLSYYDVVILPYENAKVGSMRDVVGLGEGKKIALIIGSEGGFSSDEVKLAEEKNAQVISLGKRILRCETAAIIASALIMYELGDLQG